MNKIIYIGGVARSGTSWVGQIINSSPIVRYKFQPLFSYEFKNRIHEDSSKSEFDKFLIDLFNTSSEFLDQDKKIADGQYPTFLKNKVQTVLAFKENRYQSIIEPMLRKVKNIYFIGIIRNPCAVINSWRKNQSEFPAGYDILNEWRFANCKNNGNEDYFGYYKWKEVAHLYHDLIDKYPRNVYIINYSELIDNPIKEVAKIFEFINIPLSKQTTEFLKVSTKDHSESYYSVFKSKKVKDKWKSELDPYIVSEIVSDLKNTNFYKYLK